LGTSSLFDGIPDWWRVQYFGGDGTRTNSQSCASCDPDGDGFTNLQEFEAGSDPTNSSSRPVPPVSAQTDLFFYDNLGRLAVMVDTNGTDVAFYSYDAVGNITAISRQTVGPVNVFEFSPSTGDGSLVITLQGTGFSPTLAYNTVYIGSVAATVVSATANQLQVSVPANAVSSLISVRTPYGVFTNSTTFNPGVRVSISPNSVTLSGTATQQFTAVVYGTANQSVAWYIDGWVPAGSSTAFGSLTTGGLYTAPLYPLESGFVTVHARSAVATAATEDGIATITLTPGLSPIVSPMISVQSGPSTALGPIISPMISVQSTNSPFTGPIISRPLSVGESE
jgi:YD repeat-containing protein